MNYTYKINDDILVVKLLGEIDHHNAKTAREGIDGLIESKAPKRLYLDLSAITFCDSSGLGLVMGRMKKASQYGATLIIQNPSCAVSRILNIAGMDKLVKIERN
ncbi:MAG: anti-sigma factor antagonist [Eubacteriales bacterium]|nr:anti-sigma factor antagonist [Eubacteriales bacterium]MDD4422371.1 anti-sigma factor antagonist [Eubacteriales bacterium]HBR32119.1 anti-anti-sigma factor [Clostridiales bacterium]